MERGLYITFFEPGEAVDRELPPVGPLDRLVVRHRQVVADRRGVAQAPELGIDIARWLEAELELQRALGEEPGGTKRSELRVSAPEGVYLRFAVFGEASERDPVAELGPYAVVVVSRRSVEADGQILATRTSSELASWDIASLADADSAGLHKPDIAFRTPSTAYHAQIAPVQARAPVIAPPPAVRPPLIIGADEPSQPIAGEPLFIERERRAPEIYTPPSSYAPAEEPPALTASDLELIQRVEQQRAEDTLRARVLDEERRRLGVDESDDAATTWSMRYRPADDAAPAQSIAPTSAGLDLGAAMWRMRFAIIGVLLLLVGLYGFTVVRSGGASTVPGQFAIQYVNIAQRVSSDRWDYVTNGSQRSQSAGTVTPRGVYFVVRLGVTNKTSEGAALSPSQFVLVDANGIEHGAESTLSGAYQSTENPQSQFVWPQTFPVGRTVSVPVVFDIDPSLQRGNLLKIFDLPNVRVKLD